MSACNQTTYLLTICKHLFWLKGFVVWFTLIFDRDFINNFGKIIHKKQLNINKL